MRRLPHPVALVAACAALAASAADAKTPAQQGSITGRVTDAASGQPIEAAQIQMLGTNIGTQTNGAGQFTLRGVRPGPAELRVLRVGFAEQKVSVTVPAVQSATADV